jgi:glycosyltransferase involved in cell wall biosynthesis
MTSSPISPCVSVLIPTYNRLKYISDCILSALNQEYDDFEIVIVDNCSDDGSWEICERFASNYTRIRAYRNNSNIGPVLNWMRCAELARGKFSKILFSDDKLESSCLSEMVPKLDNPDVGLVFSGAFIGSSSEDSTRSFIHSGLESMNADYFLQSVLSGAAPLSPGAVLLRTDDLRDNLIPNIPTSTPRPFNKHGAGPDVLLLLKVADKYGIVAHLDKPLVFFRSHSESFTMGKNGKPIYEGYTSAISFYLKSSGRNRAWVRYVAFRWLGFMIRFNKFECLPNFSRKYEGSGNFIECLALAYEASINIILRLLGKKRSIICFEV